MAILTLLFGREVLGTYEMDRDVFVIGRASDCDIIIDNLNISRHHSKIEKRDGLYYIEDLKSNNGTFLNGDRVTNEMLTFGDEVGVGKHTLRFDSHSQLGRSTGSLPSATNPHTQAHAIDSQGGGTVVVKAEQMAAFQEKMSVARRAHLRVTGVPGAKPVVQLGTAEVRLGKNRHCEVRIPGLFIGQTHAIIGRRSSGYHIDHVGGLRSVRVNGERTQAHVLCEGDVIELGSARLTFHDAPDI